MIEFDGIDEIFTGVCNKNISTKIKNELLDSLTEQFKVKIPTLDFYYETIVTNSEGDIYSLDYYVSSPKLKGYRINLFSIQIINLENYPVQFKDQILNKDYSINSYEELVNQIKVFITQIQVKNKIFLLLN